jgi:hypothetical protein
VDGMCHNCRLLANPFYQMWELRLFAFSISLSLTYIFFTS